MWKERALTSRKSNELDEKTKRSFTQAVSVTNEMKLRLINVLREMNVQYIVAPYEADAQLAFLSRMKIVDAVISEDSDCIPYGCRTVCCRVELDEKPYNIFRYYSNGAVMDGQVS